MRRPLVIANWKMHTSLSDAIVLATTIRDGVEDISGLEIILCPPAIWLSEISQLISKDIDHLSLGAQNIHYLSDGDYTGEISAPMVRDVAKYVIIGHSERKKYFFEDTKIISRKITAALDSGLRPIICVGENKKEENSEVNIQNELKNLLSDVNKDEYSKLIIAYEPVWAVGAEEPAEPQYAVRMMNVLRELVHFETPILYGGAADESNVYDFIKHPAIDGVLVGRAGLVAKDFVRICRIVAEYKKII